MKRYFTLCLLMGTLGLLHAQLTQLNEIGVPTYYDDFFTDAKSLNWYGNDAFSFSEAEAELQIDINKAPWEAFTLNVKEVDLTDSSYVWLEARASESVMLRIDMYDQDHRMTTPPVSVWMEYSPEFQALTFDFRSSVPFGIDASKIAYLKFYVNPGQEFTGGMALRKLHMGSYGTPGLVDLHIFPNPTVDFLSVELPEGQQIEGLKVYDLSGRQMIKKSLNGELTTADLDVSSLVPGIYVVSVESGKNAYASRFIKQ